MRIAAATPSAGDQNYPTNAQNTADLVSLDLSLDGGDVVVEFELNTLYTANQTIAAIAIDTDGSAATSSASLLGLTTTGADVAYQFDSGDPATNTITGRFPRPAGTTWKLWAVVAQADGTVMNVAFRGTREQANAGGSQFEPTEALVFPYVGAFWEDRQAALLAAGDISGASYTVDVADLENAVTRGTAVTPGLHQRVYTSAYTQGAGEGIDPNGIPGPRHRDAAGELRAVLLLPRQVPALRPVHPVVGRGAGRPARAVRAAARREREPRQRDQSARLRRAPSARRRSASSPPRWAAARTAGTPTSPSATSSTCARTWSRTTRSIRTRS